jgi:hypothetical protein
MSSTFTLRASAFAEATADKPAGTRLAKALPAEASA